MAPSTDTSTISSRKQNKTICLSLSLPRAGGASEMHDLLHLGGILCYKKKPFK